MELSKEYLKLQLYRLRQSDEVEFPARGLSFFFMKAGVGVWSNGRLPQRFEKGGALIVAAGHNGKIKIAAKEDAVFWFFSVELENLFSLFDHTEMCLLNALTQDFKDGRHLAAPSPLAKECHKLVDGIPPRFGIDHRCHLIGIIGAILSAEFATIQQNSKSLEGLGDNLIQVLDRMQTSDFLDLPVDDLARRFGCSRRHLNRLFHQHFGVGVTALRMEIRLLKAASLLRNPEFKVINVAGQCGFNHLGLFNNCFKKRFGTSPGHWRKQTPPAEGSGVPSLNLSPLRAFQVESPDFKNMGNSAFASSPSGIFHAKGGGTVAKKTGYQSKIDTQAVPSNGKLTDAYHQAGGNGYAIKSAGETSVAAAV